jgi:tripartite-type tricarboxylate transporter receptor subunit TctC
MQRKTFALAVVVALAGIPALSIAQTRTFPTEPMTIVVPASSGGAIDLASRLIDQQVTEARGQPVVVNNRTGATGVIGTDFVAKSAPDEHVLALVASSHAINPSMFRKLPFDTVKGFEAVVQTHTVPLVQVVAPGSPFKSIKDVAPGARRTRASSASHRAATAAHRISQASCSRAWQPSTCSTSRTKAARWLIRT